MWHKCVHTLYTLTKLFSIAIKFKWTGVDPNTFIALKIVVGRDFIISCINFIEGAIIHTVDRKKHLREVIKQNGNTMVFYSCKLTHAQIIYTNKEIELLIIVETPRIILYHYISTLYNHTYK